MGQLNSLVFTNAGISIINATQTGGTVTFTSVKTGNGVYDGTENLQEMTALKNVQGSFGIAGVTKTDEDTTRVRAVLNNNEVTTGYSITEFGLFAYDSNNTEVLFAIVTAVSGRENYFPPYADSPTSITMEMYLNVADSPSGITFEAMPVEGTYATAKDFTDLSYAVLKQSSIIDDIGNKAAVNLIPYPYKETTNTNNGIVWTDNGDGTISAKGTKTTSSVVQFYFNLDADLGLQPNTTYTLSGCPSGGSETTYDIRFIGNYEQAPLASQTVRDTGEGATFTTAADYTNCRLMIDFYGDVGSEIDLVFKPMLEKGSVAHNYVPYIGAESLSKAIASRLTVLKNYAGKTIVELQADLDAWISKNLRSGAKALFYGTWIPLWNSRDLTGLITPGDAWTVEIIGMFSNTRVQLMFSTYRDKQIYFVARTEGIWNTAKTPWEATKLQTPVKINGVPFDGSKDITVALVAPATVE